MKYQRFISYLYQYKDGEKVQNTGYVKVEQKGSMIRISLRSKLMEKHEPVYYVYLITKETENGNHGILLDKLAPSQGMLTYQYITRQERGFGANLSIDDFVGVLIRGQQAVYMTLWQDVEVWPEQIICVENVSSEQQHSEYEEGISGIMRNRTEPLDPEYGITGYEDRVVGVAEQMEYEMGAAGGMQSNTDAQALGINESNGDVQKSQMEGGGEWTNFSEAMDVTMDDRLAQAESAATDSSLALAENNTTDSGSVLTENSVPDEKSVKEESTITGNTLAVEEEPSLNKVMSDQSAPTGGERYRSGADYLFKNRNFLPAVEGSQLLDCIRIEPQDLGLLHMQNWKYGNNSFLNHGYYRYRYLLLGKLKFQDDSVKIILGVPSIYTNKEKYLANMFGFDQFVTARRTDRKLGQFGYWIVELT